MKQIHNLNLLFFLDIEDDKESSGSEYVPSEDEQHLLDDNELPQKQTYKVILRNTSSTSSLEISQVNNGAPACNEEIM